MVSSAADTIPGPKWIRAVKVNGGSGTSTATITMDAIVIYNSGNVTAATSTALDEIEVYIPSGKNATIALTGTGATITMYLK
jgi:hypothetical protein